MPGIKGVIMHRNKDGSSVLESIILSSPFIVFKWKIAPGWPVEYVSPNISLFGYTPSDFMEGRVSWPGITHPDDVPRLEKEVSGFLESKNYSFSQQYRIFTKKRDIRWIQDWNEVIMKEGEPSAVQGLLLDVTEKVLARQKADSVQMELDEALSKALSEYLPICMHCKGIKDDKGSWTNLESYLTARTKTRLSHGLCPECAKKHYGMSEKKD